MAKFNITPELTFADRSAWGANSAHPRRGRTVKRHIRTHVIIHHTVMPDTDSTKNQWESEDEVFKMMRRLQTVRPDLGKDVPYNFVAFLMNTPRPSMFVCEGRGEDRRGAHTKGHNSRGVAVSFAGNFHDFDVDFGQYVPLLSLFLGWLKFDPNDPSYGGPFDPMVNLGEFTPSGRKVFAHKDFSSTKCPGRVIMPFLRQVDFVNPND